MLQFWFDFGSTYSYVAAMRIEQECARAGVGVEYKPFLLGPIFSELLGIKDSPFNAQPVRGRYMWRDLERLCEKYALPWRRPTVFPRRARCAAGRPQAAARGGPPSPPAPPAASPPPAPAHRASAGPRAPPPRPAPRP